MKINKLILLVGAGLITGCNSGYNNHFTNTNKSVYETSQPDYIAKSANFMPEINIPTTDWMSFLPDQMRLIDITLPASHDSGMSETMLCTPGGIWTKQLSQTQNLNIIQQAQAGVRYFDIRPEYRRGLLYARHRTYVGSFLDADFGCSGQLIEAIFDQAEAFLVQHPQETIIFTISHTPSVTHPEEIHDTNERVIQLISQEKYQSILYKSDSQTRDLIHSTIRNMRGKLILLFEGQMYSRYINNQKGIFLLDDFPLSDEYSNTESLEIMQKDQLAKLLHHNNNDELFALDWTLTPQGAFSTSVETLATIANQSFLASFNNFVQNNGNLPNLISLDFISSSVSQKIIALNQVIYQKNSIKINILNYNNVLEKISFIKDLGNIQSNFVFNSSNKEYWDNLSQDQNNFISFSGTEKELDDLFEKLPRLRFSLSYNGLKTLPARDYIDVSRSETGELTFILDAFANKSSISAVKISDHEYSLRIEPYYDISKYPNILIDLNNKRYIQTSAATYLLNNYIKPETDDTSPEIIYENKLYRIKISHCNQAGANLMLVIQPEFGGNPATLYLDYIHQPEGIITSAEFCKNNYDY